ncbi:MAG: hypothetical protein NC191_07765 [Muribaculaceae bacterium]|nr:hypothetical protein [Muribaculaceae bacterium]
MSNIFNDIKYFFLSLREKHLLNSLKNTTKRSFSNKTGKKVFANGADLSLQTETLKLIEQTKDGVTAIVNRTNCDPDLLLSYIKAARTPVYRLNNADKYLKFIDEEEGFVCEKEGFDALFLSFVTERKFSFKTPPMFLLRDGEIEKLYMLHHFYRWYAMKTGLPGFEYETQKKFKFSFRNRRNNGVDSLSMADILAVNEAVARDQEATDFVLAYSKQIEGSKKVLDKIKNEGSANI